MGTFKVGDRVRYVRRMYNTDKGLRLGAEYIVEGLNPTNPHDIYVNGSISSYNGGRFELVTEPSTFSTQVGGSHYKDMKIQPTEYILANGMGFAEGNVIKYVSRYKAKNGVQDLKKARHYLDMLIEQEEKNGNAA